MSRGSRWSLILLLGALVATAATLDMHDTTGVELFGYRLPELCAWRRLLNRNCPGCGLTRSWVAALHGRPGLSFQMHPLGMPLLALVVGMIGYQGYRLARPAPEVASPEAGQRSESAS
ncbi:MAG: DUF2752 domain-containing protein [Planctomycetes bacterium]|nr:DUF2752 domain-containing protein [Planctomycetota bacterium]